MTSPRPDSGADTEPIEVPDDDGIPTKEELAARSAGFRWPPVPFNPGANAFDGDPAPVEADLLGEEEGASVPDGGPAAASPVRPSAWAIIEEVWLDVVAPPLPRRMAQLGWAPDPPEAYCHRCAATVGPHEATAAGCPACASRRLPWSRIVRLGEYRPPLSLFVQEVKFTRWRRLGRELGELLAAAVGPVLESAGRDPRQVLIVPVPTTFRRRMARGIDHTHVLAAAAARSLQAPLRQPLGRRHRPSQLDVAPSDRASNVSGAFRLARPRYLTRALRAGPGATILVVDDVTTTGATLRATCTALGRGLRGVPPALRPHIWAGVLCWTPPAGPVRRGVGDRGAEDDRMGPAGAAWT